MCHHFVQIPSKYWQLLVYAGAFVFMFSASEKQFHKHAAHGALSENRENKFQTIFYVCDADAGDAALYAVVGLLNLIKRKVIGIEANGCWMMRTASLDVRIFNVNDDDNNVLHRR